MNTDSDVARWCDPAMHRRIGLLAWPMILSNISVPLLVPGLELVDTAVTAMASPAMVKSTYEH